MSNSLRTMPVPEVDPKTGQVIGTNRVAYEPVVKWERLRLKKGQKEYYFLGPRSAAVEADRNYEVTNPNVVETRSGWLLALFAELYGVNFASFDPAFTAGGKNARDHWNLLRSGMTIETYKDKTRYQQDHGSAVFPAMPIEYRGDGQEPAIYALNDNGSYLDRTSMKRGIVWKKPPLEVGYRTTQYFKLVLRDDPDNVLDNHGILFLLPTRERPSNRNDHGQD